MRCEMGGGRCQNEAAEKISGRWVCPECDARIAAALKKAAWKIAGEVRRFGVTSDRK